ncbi:MAG: hypothetical protein JXA69_12355 [Phycisphaerae bacterium]|nr:hypothetical protein [Phycisphaerae bacterium]
MMRKSLVFGMLGSLWLVAIGDAAPKPSLAPTTWELRFRYSDPERIAVTVPGQAEPVVYWYMRYTIENQTGDTRDFYPTFEIVTDTLRVTQSEVGVSPEAFRAIQRRWKDALLLEPSRMNGPLLVGEDRAKHGVAIWPDIDPKAREFTVYVRGLSGETSRVRNPAYDPAKPAGAENRPNFILFKTLAIPYRLPGGGGEARSMAVPERLSRDPQWVMR